MKLPWYLRGKRWIVPVAGLGGLFTVVTGALAQPWAVTPTPSFLTWSALAMSADGRTLVAAGYGLGGYCGSPVSALIYISTNAGGSWTQTTAPSNYWSSVACSTDGTKLVAASFYDLIYNSPEAEVTWTPASAPST
jgi:hypothetical protein